MALPAKHQIGTRAHQNKAGWTEKAILQHSSGIATDFSAELQSIIAVEILNKHGCSGVL